MTAVSVSINRGFDGLKPSDITVGTSAPGAGDIELRVNLLDALSNTVTDKDVFVALDAFMRYFRNGKNVGGATAPVL